MKKIFLLTVITPFIIEARAFAQENHNEDTLKLKWKGSRIWIFEDKKDSVKKEKKKNDNFTHWGGFDIGICALTTAENQFQIPESDDAYNINYFLDLKYPRSWYFSLNMLEQNIRLYKNYLYLVTGLGAEWNSYNFRTNIILNPDSAVINAATVFMDTASDAKYIKNQLKATYIKIPLLFEFNTNNSNAKKSFHIAGGMEFGYRINSWTKRKYEQGGYTLKAKRNDDYNLSAFKYGIAIRAGYGNFTLFANYLLSPLFDKEKGPELPIYPLSAGFAVNF